MKPKVVHIIRSHLAGGTEQGMLTLMKKGFYDAVDLHVVELREGHGPLRDEIIRQLGADRVISCLPARKEDPQKVNILSTYARKVMRAGRLPLMIRELAKVFWNVNPNTAVLSSDAPHLAGRIAGMFFPKIKIVSFEHNTSGSSRLKGAAMKFTSFRNDAVFGDTQGTLDFRNRYYSRKVSPQYVVPLIVLDGLQQHTVRSHPDTFKISSLGRLDPQKNYPELIKAVALLMAEGRNIELTIAGEGDQRGELEALIKELDTANPSANIAKRIKLAGWIAEPESRSALRRSSDIYIQPSLYEGFCLAAVEALGDGIPTVVTDFAGVHEYGDEKNVLRIEGYSSKSIANTLRYMMDHYAEIAPSMSRAAFETATHYSHGAVQMQWQPAVAEMLSPRKPIPPQNSRPELCPLDHYVAR